MAPSSTLNLLAARPLHWLAVRFGIYAAAAAVSMGVGAGAIFVAYAVSPPEAWPERRPQVVHTTAPTLPPRPASIEAPPAAKPTGGVVAGLQGRVSDLGTGTPTAGASATITFADGSPAVVLPTPGSGHDKTIISGATLSPPHSTMASAAWSMQSQAFASTDRFTLLASHEILSPYLTGMRTVYALESGGMIFDKTLADRLVPGDYTGNALRAAVTAGHGRASLLTVGGNLLVVTMTKDRDLVVTDAHGRNTLINSGEPAAPSAASR